MPYSIYLNYLNLDQIYLFIHISPQRPKLNPFERTFIIKNVLAYLHMNLHDLHNSFITRILKQFEYFTKIKTISLEYTFYIFNQYNKNSAIKFHIFSWLYTLTILQKFLFHEYKYDWNRILKQVPFQLC